MSDAIVWMHRWTAGIESIEPAYQFTGDSHEIAGIVRLKRRDQSDMASICEYCGSVV
jgi:hypothetical protein